MGAALLAIAGAPALAQDSADDAVEDALVALEVTAQSGDWFTPWQQKRPQNSSGTGFLIGPGRILTNAHVVSDAKQIVVKRNGEARPYFAELEFIAHDSDLALLRVDEPRFAEDVEPLELGDLPTLRSRVRTYGFPAGGEKISRTEGVVSRIEFITYLHSGADAHLGIQTDSAINPGNSGGPVLQDGKVVGVAFQTNTRLNDVGFFIPTPVVKRFLRDIEDGHYDGYADLGLRTSNGFNLAYRDFLRLPRARSGVIVDTLLTGGSAQYEVLPDDVLLAVDGHELDDDGTIRYQGHALSYEQIGEEKLIGEEITLTLWREGAETEVTVTMQPLPEADRMRARFDVLPEYVVYAGLVFMPLEQELLNTQGNYWRQSDSHLLYAQFFESQEHPESPKPPPVLLTRILPHRINSAYRDYVNLQVVSVNGQDVQTLWDVMNGFAQGEGEYHTIRLQPGNVLLALERRRAEAAHQEILSTYGIGSAVRVQ